MNPKFLMNITSWKWEKHRKNRRNANLSLIKNVSEGKWDSILNPAQVQAQVQVQVLLHQNKNIKKRKESKAHHHLLLVHHLQALEINRENLISLHLLPNLLIKKERGTHHQKVNAKRSGKKATATVTVMVMAKEKENGIISNMKIEWDKTNVMIVKINARCQKRRWHQKCDYKK